MKVEAKKVVSLSYELKDSKEATTIIETLTKESPLQFIFGNGSMLPEFENNIKDLNPGDSFNFMLTAEQGYGELDENAVIELSKEIFMADGKLREDLVQIGNSIPMKDANGNLINGKVLKINESTITMDFNHPMAGSDLFFKGEIISIRTATAEELQHGHIHHENHDCGGCSSCG